MTRNHRAIGKMMLSSLLLSTALAACTVGPTTPLPRRSSRRSTTPPMPRLRRATPRLRSIGVDRVQRPDAGDGRAALAEPEPRSWRRAERQARATASGAGAQLLPTADLGASATYFDRSLRGAFGSVANGSPGFHRDGHEDVVGPSASWEIDLFGGLRREATAADDEAQAAEAERAGTRAAEAASSNSRQREVTSTRERPLFGVRHNVNSAD
jgi:outer membrane protein TolC